MSMHLTIQGGRPSKLPKYEFSQKDKAAIENYIKTELTEKGIDYNELKQKFFQETDPEVTPKDINNFVHNNTHLKTLLGNGISCSCLFLLSSTQKIEADCVEPI